MFTDAAQVIQVQADVDYNPNIYVENLEIDIGNLGDQIGDLATTLLQDEPEPGFCDAYPVTEPPGEPSYVGLTATINSSGAYWPLGGAPGEGCVHVVVDVADLHRLRHKRIVSCVYA